MIEVEQLIVFENLLMIEFDRFHYFAIVCFVVQNFELKNLLNEISLVLVLLFLQIY